ncbi:MAG: methyltransferase [Planctomycetes bacterium]|nr:methyltransferase [Planctomycetota bacterium]
MFTAKIKDSELSFQSKPELFSPNAIDSGTSLMLAQVELSEDDYVLDLGCGYGAVGIYVANTIGSDKVVLSDNNPVAVSTARRNGEINNIAKLNVISSDGLNDMQESGFTKIITHPPYHADFNVAKHFIEKGFNRLVIGGKMYMVTKRELWYKNKLTSIFGGVKVIDCGEYFVFIAEKRSAKYAPKLKLGKKSKKKKNRPPASE